MFLNIYVSDYYWPVTNHYPLEQCLRDTTQRHACADCGKTYAVHRSLWRHRKFECINSQPKLSCELCDYHTPHKWSMDTHKKNRHGISFGGERE